MTISFSLGNNSLGTPRIIIEGNSYILNYPCSSSTNCTHYETFLNSGQYIFEVWGGEGGFKGGKGGYSSGSIHLERRSKVYIFLGSKGPEKDLEYGLSDPSFNGGGSGFAAQNVEAADPNRSSGSGGGGTDIRIGGSSLNHRVIVAGGGGGGTYSGVATYYGGHGGGEAGFDGDHRKSSYGFGGTQSIGGTQFILGSFGSGGNGNSAGTSGGGGGGWYGGGAGQPGSVAAGGGGSGYILTVSSNKPSGYIYDVSHFLTDAIMLSGNDSFPKCTNPGTQESEDGHSGNGCARFTIVNSVPTVFFTFSCDHHTLFSSCFISLIAIFASK